MKKICVGDRRSIRYALSSAMIVGFSHFCTAQQTVSVSSYWGGRQAAPDLMLCLQVLRPDGSLCYERNFTLCHDTDYTDELATALGIKFPLTDAFIKQGFLLRVGRPISVNTDWRRNRYWQPYLLEPSNLKVKKQKGGYHLTCRWQREDSDKNYIDGDIIMVTDKQGFVLKDFTLENINATDKHNRFDTDKVERMTIRNVKLNGNKR